MSGVSTFFIYFVYLSERTNWNKNEIYKNKDIKIDFEGIDICP